MRRILSAIALGLALIPTPAAAAPGWSVGPPMPFKRAKHTLTLLDSGKVLVAGGGAVECALFDPIMESWTATGSLKAVRSGHTATLLPDGQVLVTGGATSTAELYDPASGKWADAAPMSTPRVDATATLLADGRVLVAGGASTASAEVYDPALDRWSPTAEMRAVRRQHSATLVSGRGVVVVGGSDASGPLASQETFSPITGTWDLVVTTEPRSGHAAVSLGGGVLVVGGLGPDALATTQWSASARESAAPMSLARAYPTATVVDNGQVLVTGGSSGMLKLASTELYDRARNTWALAGSMAESRAMHAATLLRDGRVLVTGGTSAPNASIATGSTSIWTPQTAVSAPGTAAFGTPALGEASDAAVVLTNTGDSRLLVRAPALGGPQAEEFTVAANGCATAVLPGDSCTIALRFTPLGIGSRAAQLTFSANTAAERHTVALEGAGALAAPPPAPADQSLPPAVTPAATPRPAPVATPGPSKRVGVPFKSSFRPPPGYSKARACSGKVTLRLRAGKRVIATRTVRLDRRCRYSTTFRVARTAVGARKILAVAVRFRGNRVMAPTSTTYQVRVPSR
jgi:hypothetical protein